MAIDITITTDKNQRTFYKVSIGKRIMCSSPSYRDENVCIELAKKLQLEFKQANIIYDKSNSISSRA